MNTDDVNAENKAWKFYETAVHIHGLDSPEAKEAQTAWKTAYHVLYPKQKI